MSIQEIRIKNFQSHRNSYLKLHPGVNVIIGASDCGKSAILRALSWAIRNRSEDKAFRSYWGGKTDVEITFSEGIQVSRVQDKHNCYYLDDTNKGIDSEYKAFRTDIPEDIVNALNLDILNLSSQFDPPFLLSDSPSDVAKTLNKVANLSDIDQSISNIRKKVLENNRELTSTEATIKSLEEQIASFSYLKQMEKDVTAYENLVCKASEVHNWIIDLDMILMPIEKDQKEIDEINLFLNIETEVDDVIALNNKNIKLNDTINQLAQLSVLIYQDQVEIEDLDKFLKIEYDYKIISEYVAKLQEVESIEKPLRMLVKLIDQNEWKKQFLTEDIQNYEAEFNKLMPDQCPLCGR